MLTEWPHVRTGLLPAQPHRVRCWGYQHRNL